MNLRKLIDELDQVTDAQQLIKMISDARMELLLINTRAHDILTLEQELIISEKIDRAWKALNKLEKELKEELK